MSSSNITSNSSCPNPENEWYIQAGQNMYQSTIFIIFPLYVIFGIAAHGVTLKAVLIEAKNEQAYIYQVYLTIARLFIAFMHLLFMIPLGLWRAPISPGPDWFRSCFICMFYLAHIGIFLSNFFFTVCEIFSLLVSADRFYAMWKPVSYRVNNIDRKWIMALFCICISIFINTLQLFHFDLLKFTRSDGSILYQITVNLAFVSSVIANFLLVFKNILEIIILIALYLCNIGMLWFFRIRRIEASRTLLTTQQAIKRQEMEKTLALLAICQSIFTTIAVTHRVAYYTLVYFDPTFGVCKNTFHVALTATSTVITDLADFLCLLVISKQFRKMIKSALGWKASNSVAPTGY